MTKTFSKVILYLANELVNEEARVKFVSLGLGTLRCNHNQKDYALLQVDESGIRDTAKILGIPRRTLQRWCRASGKRVKRCPEQVYHWADNMRKRREFWQCRGLC
jgi:ActR/RegA family two-component response regulator